MDEAHRSLGIPQARGEHTAGLLRGRIVSEVGGIGLHARNRTVPSRHIDHGEALLHKLRGRCGACGKSISWQYPIVELLAAVVAVWAGLRFGPGWTAVWAIGLGWTLLALTVIDQRTQLLPDSIVLPLLWAGLLINVSGTFVPLEQAVIGAAAGYLSLWIVYQAFLLLTGKHGMGFGDFKLLAALGAWMGWMSLPWIVLLSSVVGLAWALLLLLAQRMQRDQPMPFGPFLAIAGWIHLLESDTLLALLA